MEVSETYLAVRWSTSRGRDTYGYNICSVTDQATSKRYSCNGGGYDMLGTSFGEWLTETYQNALHEIGDRAHTTYNEIFDATRNDDGLYGMYRYADGSLLTVLAALNRCSRSLRLSASACMPSGTVRATPRVTSSPAPSEPGRLRPARSLEARPGFGCCGFSTGSSFK